MSCPTHFSGPSPFHHFSGAAVLFDLALFAVPVVVAVIALTFYMSWLAIVGFLQGMWWLAAPYLTASIVILTYRPHCTVVFSLRLFLLTLLVMRWELLQQYS